MPTKLNKQVIIEFLKEHNCNLESEYINTKTPIKFRLPCGHINKSKYDLMKRGDGSHFICDTCYPTAKKEKILKNLDSYTIPKDDTTRHRYDKHVYKHLRIKFSKNFNSSLKYRKDFEPFRKEYIHIECKNCLLTKHRSLFYNSNLYKTRKRPICKKCNVTDKKERVENWSLDQYINNMIYTAKQSAKKRSKKYINKGEVSITPQDIHDLIKLQNNKCPYTGVELIWSVNAPPLYKASIDRIDSDKGYTKDNVQLVSHSTNTAKSDMTTSEWLLFRQKLSENL